MPTLEERVRALELLKPQIIFASNVAAALEGRQADATLTLPHNDSWLFEDNVDATHPANLRYIIAANTQRIVSARLSIHLAPYRTYNSLSLTSTGAGSAHNHTSAAHSHQVFTSGGNAGDRTSFTDVVDGGGSSVGSLGATNGGVNLFPVNSFSTTPGATGNEAAHTHTVSGSAVLGVTEGATAAGVTLTFDGGPDVSPNLGGPFSADAIELNVGPYLVTTPGVWHTIAMQPNGLGRIEAHLRLGVYVSAAQPI